MLRTKGGDHNSYASSDEVNNLDWEALTPESDQWQMVFYYYQLITIRRENDFFTKADVAAEVLENNAIAVTWTMDGETVAYAIINPNDEEMHVDLPEGDWWVLLSPTPLDPGSGEAEPVHEATVPAVSVLIVKR